MRKLLSTLALMATIMFTVAFTTTPAQADIFVGKGEINISVAGTQATIALSGDLAAAAVDLVQFRDYPSDRSTWMQAISFANGRAMIDVSAGNRFNIRNAQGQWLLLTPTMMVNPYAVLRFTGQAGLDCSDPKGCAVAVK